jgi:hypothetical protein
VPLDALYPTMRVSSDDGKQQTHHRMSAMYENTYQEDVQNETYQEEGSYAKNVMMMALHHQRSPKPEHKSGPDYDAGSKSKTWRRRRSR